MERKQEERLKVELTTLIDGWLEKATENGSWPTLGDNTAEIMAAAAMAVLRGIADAQDYLAANDILKED